MCRKSHRFPIQTDPGAWWLCLVSWTGLRTFPPQEACGGHSDEPARQSWDPPSGEAVVRGWAAMGGGRLTEPYGAPCFGALENPRGRNHPLSTAACWTGSALTHVSFKGRVRWRVLQTRLGWVRSQ